MLLAVCVPDKQPGMERMLEKELEGLDAEVIHDSWQEALASTDAEFVCLLEKNSALSSGSIKASMKEFIENPLYRKLAMVSPIVDMPQFKAPISFTYTVNDWHKGLAVVNKPRTDSFHNVRIGFVPGAIIRRSSLQKAAIPLTLPPVPFSVILSLFFWQHGLRVALQPQSLYYAPENVSYDRLPTQYRSSIVPEQKTADLWQHEMIP